MPSGDAAPFFLLVMRLVNQCLLSYSILHFCQLIEKLSNTLMPVLYQQFTCQPEMFWVCDEHVLTPYAVELAQP